MQQVPCVTWQRWPCRRTAAAASTRATAALTAALTPTLAPTLAPTKVSDRYSVPMVLVVVEGGPNTLKTVREFLVGGCPVVLLRGSGGAADAISRCFDLLPQPSAGRGEQGTAGAGAGAEEAEDVEAEETEEAEAEEAEAKRLGLSREDEVRATKVSVEAELDARYEAKRDDLRAIMLHAGGGRRLGRPLLFSFHSEGETEFDEQLLKAVLKVLTLTLTQALTLTLTLTLTRRVHGQVPRAPGTPPRAAERALDQRHYQGPGGEAQDQWHVERQGSLVIHGRAREPPGGCVLVKVLYIVYIKSL